MKTFVFALLLSAFPLCMPLAGELDAPPLQLAKLYRSDLDLPAYWVSEKLDGVRARWDGARLISRQGNTFAAPAWFTAGFPEQPLDGELWIGRGRFEQVSGIVRRKQPRDADWRQVRLMVFDLPHSPLPFGRRLEQLRQLIAASASPHLQLIAQFRVDDQAALMRRLEQVVAAGGEGLMLHHGDALYRNGRADHLLKLKTHEDAEARVLAHLPGKGRLAGMLGALLVETGDGLRFRLGSGFSDAQRRDPPALGSIVTFKYHGLTRNGVPRFASFLRIREDGTQPSPLQPPKGTTLR